MSQAHLILSENARMHLAQAGTTTGWWSTWLMSAGADRVSVHSLDGESWRQAKGWQIFFAEESELMRVALHHERRLGANEDGERNIVGADPVEMGNPDRQAWFYRRGEKQWPTLLLPIGDVAYQRFHYLSLFSGDRAFRPLHVFLGDSDEQSQSIPLEPGLYGRIEASFDDDHMLLNDNGYLPEEQLMHTLLRYNLKIRFAESCTAGGAAARLARVPGASDVLDRGWVTYSNEAKNKLLGVSKRTLKAHGAVSREVVEAMAKKGCDDESVCVAISGIAGPDGGSDDRPVGTVWMATALSAKDVKSRQYSFTGSRTEIQSRAVVYAFALALEYLSSS
ncbi:MAG: CinA family protein [Mariprofundaceae bacterium]